jgi:UDP-N-acetylglucosamine 4,6-dehydratase
MRKWAKNVTFVIGDVRDAARVKWAMQTHRPDYVIHAAALKHVATGEDHPYEAVRTNIAGTQNVMEAVVATESVERAVFLSTDKACEPVNLYGATKMVAERLWLSGNAQREVFVATRWGNVVGSRGSVLHAFKQYAKDGVFRIHDKRMTRFAVTLDDAVDIVALALSADPGYTLIPIDPAMRIIDLARAFDENAAFDECGIGAGEKLAETLLNPYERARAQRRSDVWYLPPDAGGRMPETMERYSSDSGEYMSIEKIRGMTDDLSV